MGTDFGWAEIQPPLLGSGEEFGCCRRFGETEISDFNPYERNLLRLWCCGELGLGHDVLGPVGDIETVSESGKQLLLIHSADGEGAPDLEFDLRPGILLAEKLLGGLHPFGIGQLTEVIADNTEHIGWQSHEHPHRNTEHVFGHGQSSLFCLAIW